MLRWETASAQTLQEFDSFDFFFFFFCRRIQWNNKLDLSLFHCIIQKAERLQNMESNSYNNQAVFNFTSLAAALLKTSTGTY